VFTGIIEDLGWIAKVERSAQGASFTVTTRLPLGDLPVGASVCVSGACMTVVGHVGDSFRFDVSAESLRCTTLGILGIGDRVNLERSLRLQDRLGGHLVTGHVDGIGEVMSIVAEGDSSIYRFRVPPSVSRLTVEKGSIAIDGISLTCFHCADSCCEVAVIPHTRMVTTLGARIVGDRVNVEADLIGKYVARLLQPRDDRDLGSA
jgi:riboflavin synthase